MEILCPTCPVCGSAPTMVLNPEQAFCGDDDCPAFSWNMTKSKDWNIDNVKFHDISHLEPPREPS